MQGLEQGEKASLKGNNSPASPPGAAAAEVHHQGHRDPDAHFTAQMTEASARKVD